MSFCVKLSLIFMKMNLKVEFIFIWMVCMKICFDIKVKGKLEMVVYWDDVVNVSFEFLVGRVIVYSLVFWFYFVYIRFLYFKLCFK